MESAIPSELISSSDEENLLMSFPRKFMTAIAGPLALLLILGLFAFGFFALLAGTLLLATYQYITLNVIFAVPVFVLIKMYFSSFRKSINSETSWKNESKTVVISGLLLITLISLNYWQGVITAPIALFIYGLYCTSIIYLISKEGRESALKNATDSSYRFAPLSSKIPKWVIGNIFALLVLSGYWFTEIQKNEQIRKDEGIQQALDLANYSVFFGPPSKASVRVDSIERVDFKKVDSSEGPGKILEMCITIWLEGSRDGYYYNSLYPSEQVCVTESAWGGGWSKYDLQEEVEKLVKGKY
jgi:hypothetical protein